MDGTRGRVRAPVKNIDDGIGQKQRGCRIVRRLDVDSDGHAVAVALNPLAATVHARVEPSVTLLITTESVVAVVVVILIVTGPPAALKVALSAGLETLTVAFTVCWVTVEVVTTSLPEMEIVIRSP